MDAKRQFEALLSKAKEYIINNDFQSAAAAFDEIAEFCTVESQKTTNSGAVNRSIRSRAILFDEYAAFIKRNNGFSAAIMDMFGISYTVLKPKPTENDPEKIITEDVPEKAEKTPRDEETKKPKNKDDEDFFNVWNPADENEANKSESEEAKKKTEIRHEVIPKNTPEDVILKNDIPKEANEEINEKISEASASPDGKLRPPMSFADFVGQEIALKRLKIAVDAARLQNRNVIPNIILHGSRGLGKTTIMKLVANELGVPIRLVDCTTFGTGEKARANLFKFIKNVSLENTPVVIGMDEIHRLSNALQTSLLTTLNEKVFRELENGQDKTYPLTNCTFIGATTDPQDVVVELLDRWIQIKLEFYTRTELRKIYVNKFAAMGLTPMNETLDECINRCRSSIRDAEKIVDGLKELAIIDGTKHVSKDLSLKYFALADLDAIGLNKTEKQILNALADEPTGALAENTIAAKVGLKTKVYSYHHEPYLLHMKLITKTPRGRSLTDKGLAYLKDGTYLVDEYN